MKIKKWIAAGLMVIFVALSICFINTNPIEEATDAKIVTNIKKTNEKKPDSIENINTNLINYDDQGNNNTSILEEYFDSNDQPITVSEGYHSRFRIFDEKGNNIRNFYLDIYGNLVITSLGYAIDNSIFSDDGKEISVRFFDTNGNPVCTASYGYGKNNEYDKNGRLSKITYVDNQGKPYKTKRGYAIVTRTYYESEDINNGKIEYEFYFDENGMPISLSNGEYGIHKDNKEEGYTLVTYLNAEGKPMATLSGYASVARTLNDNNSVNTEMYFDLEGKPYSLSEGQYGVKWDNGELVYLDQNGHEIFNIKNFLHRNSRLVVIFALFLMLLSTVMDKRFVILFAAVYIIIILYMTLMFRESIKSRASFELLWLNKLFGSSGTRADILKNIWLFIPIGTLLYQMCPKRRIILIPVALSIGIEVIQFFSGTGLCELDDIISNGFGTIIGFEAGKILCGIKRKIIDIKDRA